MGPQEWFVLCWVKGKVCKMLHVEVDRKHPKGLPYFYWKNYNLFENTRMWFSDKALAVPQWLWPARWTVLPVCHYYLFLMMCRVLFTGTLVKKLTMSKLTRVSRDWRFIDFNSYTPQMVLVVGTKLFSLILHSFNIYWPSWTWQEL
jgi:hypothetical protein